MVLPVPWVGVEAGSRVRGEVLRCLCGLEQLSPRLRVIRIPSGVRGRIMTGVEARRGRDLEPVPTLWRRVEGLGCAESSGMIRGLERLLNRERGEEAREEVRKPFLVRLARRELAEESPPFDGGWEELREGEPQRPRAVVPWVLVVLELDWRRGFSLSRTLDGRRGRFRSGVTPRRRDFEGDLLFDLREAGGGVRGPSSVLTMRVLERGV